MPCTNGLDVPARHSAKGKGCAVQPLFAKVTPLRSPDCPTEADEDSVRGTHGSGPRQGARHSFHSLSSGLQEDGREYRYSARSSQTLLLCIRIQFLEIPIQTPGNNSESLP